jgi:hypothetical protein
MIDGINDSDEHAKKLAQIAQETALFRQFDFLQSYRHISSHLLRPGLKNSRKSWKAWD